MKAHEKLIEYRNKYVNRPDEKINTEYLSMIDSVLDEWNRLRRKIEEYEKRENIAQFFRQFEETYLNAKNAGFQNINVDLMIGLPNQSLNNVKQDLEKITNLKPTHSNAAKAHGKTNGP